MAELEMSGQLRRRRLSFWILVMVFVFPGIYFHKAGAFFTFGSSSEKHWFGCNSYSQMQNQEAGERAAVSFYIDESEAEISPSPSVCGFSRKECLEKGYFGYIDCKGLQCVNHFLWRKEYCLEKPQAGFIRVSIDFAPHLKKLALSMKDRQNGWTKAEMNLKEENPIDSLNLNYESEGVVYVTECTIKPFEKSMTGRVKALSPATVNFGKPCADMKQ